MYLRAAPVFALLSVNAHMLGAECVRADPIRMLRAGPVLTAIQTLASGVIASPGVNAVQPLIVGPHLLCRCGSMAWVRSKGANFLRRFAHWQEGRLRVAFWPLTRFPGVAPRALLSNPCGVLGRDVRSQGPRRGPTGQPRVKPWESGAVEHVKKGPRRGPTGQPRVKPWESGAVEHVNPDC